MRAPGHADGWDPRDADVQDDQLAAYDRMRQRCPVAHSDYLQWSVFRHADVMQVLQDPGTFGNAVSAHVSIPNGMDPPEHTPWRALVESYFVPERLAAFEPRARRIAREQAQALPAGELDWMDGFAHETAVRLLCAYMEWGDELHQPLRDWMRRSQAATMGGDRSALVAVAFEFDGHIRGQLDLRRGEGPLREDLIGRLMRESIDGRPITDAEIVSVLRNWTVGELATLASCLGILPHYLAGHPDLQQRLRAEPQLLRAAIDEILRIHPPLIANRRIVRQPACVGGRDFAPGERLTLMWASANRDEAVFGNPDECRLDRDPSLNLLYGAGVHVCPGAELSRLQLRVVMEELLASTRWLAPVAGQAPVNARYPGSGYSQLPLAVER